MRGSIGGTGGPLQGEAPMISMPRPFLARAALALSATVALAIGPFAPSVRAQDQDIDPPGRVGRLA